MDDAWRKGSHLWIPASFLTVAVLLLYLARERGGAWWALIWPAADCAAVGAAYFGPAGKIFGKRGDGTLGGLPRWALFPFRAVSGLVWRLQVALSPEPCCNEVAPGVFLGRRPRAGEYPPELELVVDLTAEFAKPPYHPAAARYRCLATLDAFVPEAAPFLALVDEACAARRVLVHCAQGHGRSAAFAAALLLRKGLARDLPEAMARIRAVRPACALNPVQAALAARAK